MKPIKDAHGRVLHVMECKGSVYGHLKRGRSKKCIFCGKLL